MSGATVASDVGTPSGKMRVGFIGLGDQGGGMADRLIACGYPVTLWARRPASLERYRSTAASFAEDPAALGAASDLVGICVVDDAGVQEVLLGDHGVLSGMAPGSVVVVHSTISLEVCDRIAEAADAVGVHVIDAPVSGGGFAAAEGNLTVLAGGNTEVYEKARPALEEFGTVFHLGPLGSGLIAKLVNNTLHAANYALARNAIDAGEAMGLSADALGRALTVSSGNSYSLNAAVMVGGFDVLAPMVGPLLRKDVSYFESLAAEQKVSAEALVTTADLALTEFGYPRG